MRAVDHYGDVIVTAKLDGTYDKTGLPDPLILTFYFTVRDDKITMLIILLNKPAETLRWSARCDSRPIRPSLPASGFLSPAAIMSVNVVENAV